MKKRFVVLYQASNSKDIPPVGVVAPSDLSNFIKLKQATFKTFLLADARRDFMQRSHPTAKYWVCEILGD